MNLPVVPDTTLQGALSRGRTDYLRIQQRICKELGVDLDSVASSEGTEATAALQAFAHLAYLWSNPVGPQEGYYDDDAHPLVWSCAVDVYLLDGPPSQEVPIRMRGIVAEAARFCR